MNKKWNQRVLQVFCFFDEDILWITMDDEIGIVVVVSWAIIESNWIKSEKIFEYINWIEMIILIPEILINFSSVPTELLLRQ